MLRTLADDIPKRYIEQFLIGNDRKSTSFKIVSRQLIVGLLSIPLFIHGQV